IEFGGRFSTSTTSQQFGFVFASKDQRLILQARLDGFALSRLAPYENWETFRDEARRLWTAYRRYAHPEKIVRLAVRYVNRLDLPLPLRDLKDFLATVPEVSPRLPQGLAGFFMQLNIPQMDSRNTLLLTETMIEPAGPGVISVVLDIDVGRSDDVPGDEE